jgi:hypothetical protein
MKQVILVGGICLLTTVGFSQQVSSARNAVVKPEENKETIPVEIVSDSSGILHSTARNRQSVVVPLTKETESNIGKHPEKVTTVSSAKKPD